ncbi:hypothetical protein DFH11DRAFT_728186 [Phellopilus nigrolimitatus]|nr:hypothetical protein DFH11DRAFT_728186 [Phellopilus nigrolimitatus]
MTQTSSEYLLSRGTRKLEIVQMQSDRTQWRCRHGFPMDYVSPPRRRRSELLWKPHTPSYLPRSGYRFVPTIERPAQNLDLESEVAPIAHADDYDQDCVPSRAPTDRPMTDWPAQNLECESPVTNVDEDEDDGCGYAHSNTASAHRSAAGQSAQDLDYESDADPITDVDDYDYDGAQSRTASDHLPVPDQAAQNSDYGCDDAYSSMAGYRSAADASAQNLDYDSDDEPITNVDEYDCDDAQSSTADYHPVGAQSSQSSDYGSDIEPEMNVDDCDNNKTTRSSTASDYRSIKANTIAGFAANDDGDESHLDSGAGGLAEMPLDHAPIIGSTNDNRPTRGIDKRDSLGHDEGIFVRPTAMSENSPVGHFIGTATEGLYAQEASHAETLAKKSSTIKQELCRVTVAPVLTLWSASLIPWKDDGIIPFEFPIGTLGVFKERGAHHFKRERRCASVVTASELTASLPTAMKTFWLTSAELATLPYETRGVGRVFSVRSLRTLAGRKYHALSAATSSVEEFYEYRCKVHEKLIHKWVSVGTMRHVRKEYERLRRLINKPMSIYAIGENDTIRAYSKYSRTSANA